MSKRSTSELHPAPTIWKMVSNNNCFNTHVFSLKSYIFRVQPVFHNWCNEGCCMYLHVCGVMHIKEPLNCFGHQRRWDIKTNKNCLAHVFFPFQLVLHGSAVINKTVIYYLVYENGFQLVPKVIYSIQLGFNIHIQSKLL